MRGFVFIVLFAWLLAGCQGGMKAMSADQGELISLAYQDDGDTRDVHGSSTSGESFSGSLLWTKDERNSGNFRGDLIGENERTLQVAIKCNSLKRKCAGTARDNNGLAFNVF